MDIKGKQNGENILIVNFEMHESSRLYTIIEVLSFFIKKIDKIIKGVTVIFHVKVIYIYE